MRWEIIKDGLRVLAPAKLNLYLEVGPRRSDGFHDIDSIFQTVTLFDELEFRSRQDGTIVLEEEGIACGEENLVHRAARALQDFLRAQGALDPSRGAEIRLRKRIPQGGGLGGGSSDAAATLLALARMWNVDVGADVLARLAAGIGSDVPFFLTGGTARCRGRGEKVASLSEAFEAAPPFHYVLAYPRLAISTRAVYEALDAARDGGLASALTPPGALDSMGAASIHDQLRSGQLFFNRLESVVTSAFPAMRRLHDRLGEEGFVNVLMSGSGSTIYGHCRSAAEAERRAEQLSAQLDAVIFAVRSERGGQ
jgi:4-diphosphocytidyl-2-C-methyl-D-erythritol kinase